MLSTPSWYRSLPVARSICARLEIVSTLMGAYAPPRSRESSVDARAVSSATLARELSTSLGVRRLASRECSRTYEGERRGRRRGEHTCMRAPRGEHLHAQRLEEEGGGLANRALDVEHRWLEHVVERAVTNRERPTRRAREGAAPVEGIPRLVHGAPDEGGNQWSSVVISGHQWSSEVLRASRGAPDEGGNHGASVVISGHQ